MKKTAMSITFLAFLVSCGVPLDSASETKSSDSGSGMTVALADDTELPPCSQSNENQLIYIMSSEKFRMCRYGSWVSIEIKADQEKHGSIDSIRDISSIPDDLCPGSDAICAFKGGQITRYVDGTIFLMGSILMTIIDYDISNVVSYMHTPSAFFADGYETIALTLTPHFQQSNADMFKALYMSYSIPDDIVAISIDGNGDMIFDDDSGLAIAYPKILN